MKKVLKSKPACILYGLIAVSTFVGYIAGIIKFPALGGITIGVILVLLLIACGISIGLDLYKEINKK